MKIPGAAAIALIFFLFTHAQAGVTSTTGAVGVVANPPSNLTSNGWESNTAIRAFVERLALVLPSNLTVDITAPGTSPGTTDQHLSPGTISAGTLVDTFTLHFDVVGTRANNKALE